MALNCSHLVSPMRIGEMNRENRDRFVDFDGGDNNGNNMDWETVLPADPFEMHISSTVNAITGLFGYLEGSDFEGYGRRSDVGVSRGDSWGFAELNFLFNQTSFPPVVDDRMFSTGGVDGCFRFDSGFDFGWSTQGVNFGGNGDSSIIGQNGGGCVGFGYSTEGVNLGNNGYSSTGQNGGFGFGCSMEGVILGNGNSSIGQNGGGFGFCCSTEGVSFGNGNFSIVQNDVRQEITSVAIGTNDGASCPALSFDLGNGDSRFRQNDVHQGVIYVDIDSDYVAPPPALSFDLGNGNSRIGQNDVHQESISVDVDFDDGDPHPALSFALCYLGVRDLLSVERVCKSLRSTVLNDPLLWKSIHIDDPPLNERITDDILVQLTSRAQGNLRCLDLVKCQRITDDGLKRVLESNLRLTKLSVPGCTRLNIDSIVSSLRAFKMVAVTGIKHLRIGGLYGVTQYHYEELVSLLDAHNHIHANNHKPHYYTNGNFYISIEDGRPIDIEMCPRCQNFKLVYDCPAESCQGKGNATHLCRACTICIPRCAQCGKCFNDEEYEETFCLEYLCSYCLKQLSICTEKQDIELSPSKNAAASFHG